MDIHVKPRNGFTLAELMVVVAVIGILSMVAVPQYKKYVIKSRKTEAKMGLASIFVAEQSAFAEYATYGTCLDALGYIPPGEVAAKHYFTFGFVDRSPDAAYGNQYISARNSSCIHTNGGYGVDGKDLFLGLKFVPDTSADCSFSSGIACLKTVSATACRVTSADQFTACAAGLITPPPFGSAIPIVSCFMMDQTKKFTVFDTGCCATP
jgi:prepilin-type N-terminal cleavage/methylation domain-containing protein